MHENMLLQKAFHHIVFYIYYKEKGLDIVKALHIAV